MKTTNSDKAAYLVWRKRLGWKPDARTIRKWVADPAVQRLVVKIQRDRDVRAVRLYAALHGVETLEAPRLRGDGLAARHRSSSHEREASRRPATVPGWFKARMARLFKPDGRLRAGSRPVSVDQGADQGAAVEAGRASGGAGVLGPGELGPDAGGPADLGPGGVGLGPGELGAGQTTPGAADAVILPGGAAVIEAGPGASDA